MKEDDISTLSQAYSSKVQQKKIKYQVEQRQIDLENSIKFQNLLESMLAIRTAFRELLTIDFGSRFSLELIESDYLGWPSFKLFLKDTRNEINETPTFVVRANDFYEENIIEFISNSELRTLAIKDKSVALEIPTYLRKNLRQYLDNTTKFAVENENKPAEQPTIELDMREDNLSKEELVVEDNLDFSDFDILPILDEVEKL